MSKGLRLCKDFFSETWICLRIAIPQLDTKTLEFELFLLDASLHLRPLESSEQWNLLGWRDTGLWHFVPVPEADLNMQGEVEFGGPYSPFQLKPFCDLCVKIKKIIASKFEQYYMIFLAWLCWKILLVLNSVSPFISHMQMAFVSEDVADGCNNKILLFNCWCFVWARGLGWQILKQLCLIWTSTNKAKSIAGYFFAVLGGNSSIQWSVLLLFGIIFYLWKEEQTWKFTSPRTAHFLLNLKVTTPATAAAALCSAQNQLTRRFGNDFDIKYMKSPHFPENIGWIILHGSM